MKTADLRNKSAQELSEELVSLRKTQFEKRMAFAAGQLTATHELGQLKRNIARVKTVLTEKSRTAGSEGGEAS